MFSPQSRTPVARILVAGACASALLLGPVTGGASADDASLAKTIYERAQQLNKRETKLSATLKTLQRSPGLSRATSAQKASEAFLRTTVAFRDEVRGDDGSTDKGVEARDALLPELTKMAAAASTVDTRLVATVKKRKVTKAAVTKIVSAKRLLDKQIGKAIDTVARALASDAPVDPAPAPTDPTV